jgi:two-component system CheB/CheR fusion protein
MTRPTDGTRAPRRRVLIADDDRDMARGLNLVLEIWGFDVIVAHDGLTALAAVREHLPRLDVGLLDIALPKLDGLALARQIREQPGGTSLLLVALTGYGGEGQRQASRSAGFDEHLIKPVDPDVLRRLLGGPPRAR